MKKLKNIIEIRTSFKKRVFIKKFMYLLNGNRILRKRTLVRVVENKYD